MLYSEKWSEFLKNTCLFTFSAFFISACSYVSYKVYQTWLEQKRYNDYQREYDRQRLMPSKLVKSVSYEVAQR